MKNNWKQCFKKAVAVMGVLFTLAPAQAATRKQVVFSQDFESASSVSNPTTYMKREMSSNGTYALRTQIVSADAGGSQLQYFSLSAAQVNDLKGGRIKFSASVKAEAVAQPSDVKDGIKVMLVIEKANGIQSRPQPLNVYGTFNWKYLQTLVEKVPTDTVAVTFVVGLVRAVGVAWFDNLKIEMVRPARVRPATQPTGPIYKGHPGADRLRGAMVSDKIQNSPNGYDAQVLGTQWKANVARYQLVDGTLETTDETKAGDFAAYNSWLNGKLSDLDRFLTQARTNGMYVVIDLHTPPGGTNTAAGVGGNRLFQDLKYQDQLVTTWQTIATRYKDNTTVWGYDIVNEPFESDGMLLKSAPGAMLPGWNQIALRVAQAIRVIDNGVSSGIGHALIIEPEFYANPEAFDYFTPLSGVTNVVYSFHMYQPHDYTHQRLNNANDPEVDAPTTTVIHNFLIPAINFQKDYNVHLYVGEFSAIRWAPDADTYLYNVMQEFETNGWDWTYHAFREGHMWSLEYPDTGYADTDPHPVSTTRQTRVREKLNFNQKPW